MVNVPCSNAGVGSGTSVASAETGRMLTTSKAASSSAQNFFM